VPVRIYALAKDLKMDGKVLADLCTKAGIPGKGSALASLEDDEVAKLRAYMDGLAAKKAGAPSPTPDKGRIGAPIRTDHAAPVAGKKPPVIPTIRPRTAEPSAPPEPAEPVPAAEMPAKTPPKPPIVEPPVEAPEVAAQATPAAPMEPESPQPPREERGGPLRDTTFGRGKGPIRVLGGGPRGDSGTPRRDGGSGSRRDGGAAAPRFAAMPEVKQPPPGRTSGAQAQKPIISLAPSQLKTGASVESVIKTLEQKQTAAAKKGPKAGAAGDTPLGPLAGRGGAKGKKPGAGGRDEEEGGRKPGMGDVRAERQRKRVTGGDDDEGGRSRSRLKKSLTRIKGHTTTAPRKGKVQVELPATVRSFSEQAGVSNKQIQGVLFKTMGLMATINSAIPDEYVELLAAELGLEIEIKQPESLEEKLLNRVQREDEPDQLVVRPPIVTFLGHVDHGKTSLLDRIIGTNVVAGEAGGITQHIRAYQIHTKSGRDIAFVDTPGHEAFTEMRARGANVTDIAVLVVAADDGIMRQTEEAISHAKAAGVPIVVAMNKVDLPGANQQRVLEQLSANELLPSEWGGEVEVVRTSATKGIGIDELQQTLLLVADIHEYKANPDRDATGICLEAEQEPGRGVIAKVMVRNGTLREGDVIVCGAAHGRVKAMYDTLDGRKKLKEAGPSMPVNLTGLDVAPNAGDAFYVLDDIAEAREIAIQRASDTRERTLNVGGTKRVSLEEFQRRLAEGRVGQEDDVVTLNLIIRADVRGSIEAINKEFSKFDHPEVQIRVLQAMVGGISVADVTLASASDAVIVGFNVIPDEDARAMAEERGVEIRRYDIIYKLTDDIKAMLEGKLKPEERNVDLGRAVVKQVFTISRVGAVAGCYVIQGTVERNARVKVFRDGRVVGDYAIETLRREKDDVKEVPRGMECGIKLQNFNDIKQDDVLEVYKIEEVARTL
jgi:translation initiation factor IF-2